MSIANGESPKQRLLARQVSLLRHLADPLAFEVGRPEAALAGVDEARLRLVGRMSFDKRMSKIRTALPRTFSFVPHVDGMSEGEFASRFPPYTNLRQENARQFVDYLREVWDERSLEPGFLPDLAAVEAAIVRVNAIVAEDRATAPSVEADGVFRLARDIELLRCGYDVQPFFARGEGRRPPVRRDVHLVVGSSRNGAARICEVSEKLFDFLRSSAAWRPTDMAEIRTDPEMPKTIGTLARMEIIEVKQ